MSSFALRHHTPANDDAAGQEKVASQFLSELVKFDRSDLERTILNIVLFVPFSEGQDEGRTHEGESWSTAKLCLDFSDFIQLTYDSFDAGNMLVSGESC